MACVCVLPSCEKESVAKKVENNATSNLKPANFVLIQKGCVDEYGFVGDLYHNESDSKFRCLVLYEQQPQTRSHQEPQWTGNLEPVYEIDENGNIFLWSYICNDDRSPKNCRTLPGGGFETNQPL